MALPQQPPDLFSETESGKKHLESNLELEAQREDEQNFSQEPDAPLPQPPEPAIAVRDDEPPPTTEEQREKRAIVKALDLWMNLFFWSYVGVLIRFYTTEIANLTGTSDMSSLWAQIIGCWFMGIVIMHKPVIDPEYAGLYVGMATGLCGSCTTFSSWQQQAAMALLKWPGTVNDNTLSNWYRILTFTTIQAWGFGMSYAAYKFGRECAGLLPFLDEKRNRKFRIEHRYAEEFVMAGLFLGSSGLLFGLLAGFQQWDAFFSVVMGPFGSITRYYTGLLLNKPGLPLGTFAVNMAGCTILGIMSDVMLIENNFAGDSVTHGVVTGVMTGFCGCLTTVSTFMVELCSLSWTRTSIYATASVSGAVCIYLLTMGIYIWVT